MLSNNSISSRAAKQNLNEVANEIAYRNALLSRENQEAERAKEKARNAGEKTREEISRLAHSTSRQTGTGNSPKQETNHSSRGWIVALIAITAIIIVTVVGKSSKTSQDEIALLSGSRLEQSQQSVSQQINQEELKAPFQNGSVFPDSSTRLLRGEEIAALRSFDGLSRATLIQHAINELYARNHYSFTQEYWKDFYGRCPWYSDWGLDDDGAYQLFNDIEKDNLQLLIEARSAEKGR